MMRLWLLLVVLLLVGCKTKESITEVHDTTYVSKYLRDSIFAHDSIYVREYMRGDTVFVDKYHQVWRYKERLSADTIYRYVSNDKFIRYTVKEKMPWYKQLLMYYSAYTILILFAICITLYLYNRHLLRKQQKR